MSYKLLLHNHLPDSNSFAIRCSLVSYLRQSLFSSLCAVGVLELGSVHRGGVQVVNQVRQTGELRRCFSHLLVSPLRSGSIAKQAYFTGAFSSNCHHSRVARRLRLANELNDWLQHGIEE